jgi:choline dehydrogenase
VERTRRIRPPTQGQLDDDTKQWIPVFAQSVNDGDHFEVVIVGAGSSGAVLAARLSDAGRDVLLLEAGEAYQSVAEIPEEVRLASSMSAALPGNPRNWGFIGQLTPELSYPIPRGKILGGSSALNGAYFIRGTPEDFQTWEDLGNPEWSWHKVLPFFKSLETDADFRDECHGLNGPIPVARVAAQNLSPVSEAFIEACIGLGFPVEPDKNAAGAPGVGCIPFNVNDGTRVNSAIGYILPRADRRNLTVVGGAMVRRVVFDGTRAVGVEVDARSGPVTVGADEVVLSAGAVKSPHLLMLSGIGPADDLRKHGIDVKYDSRGVGQNFADHPDLYVYYQSRMKMKELRGEMMAEVALHHTAPDSEVLGDLEIIAGVSVFRSQMLSASSKRSALTKLSQTAFRASRAWRAMKGASVSRAIEEIKHQGELRLYANLMQEVSRGSVSLQSDDPLAAPRVEYNYFSEEWDRRRCRLNVRLAAELLRSRSMSKVVLARTSPTDEALASDTLLDRWMLTKTGTSIHTSGSCKMGSSHDELAVVDERCRVHGVEGLRVVDTSIMPTLVRRGPAATAMMIGERAAEFLT